MTFLEMLLNARKNKRQTYKTTIGSQFWEKQTYGTIIQHIAIECRLETGNKKAAKRLKQILESTGWEKT